MDNWKTVQDYPELKSKLSPSKSVFLKISGDIFRHLPLFQYERVGLLQFLKAKLLESEPFLMFSLINGSRLICSKKYKIQEITQFFAMFLLSMTMLAALILPQFPLCVLMEQREARLTRLPCVLPRYWRTLVHHLLRLRTFRMLPCIE